MTRNDMLEHCRRFPLIPVLAFTDCARAVDISGALLAGGAAVLEITYRTEAAQSCIAAVANAYPDAVIAAGSVRTIAQLQSAKDAGASFAVSPGATETLLTADILPLLPAAATASEVMKLAEHGYYFVKFFPATAAGGVNTLKAFYGPLQNTVFCPTGGINLGNAADFLALPNVVCAGSSWLVQDGDNADTVYKKTQQAQQLKQNKENTQ
ncbi:MAG: bifunctional 4-hydroxy-2-oxoglutarate aldolase/2-dehydro-3-deoxy-phosphogluconate aldolase [Gammaproteobacteria bacterium WSBS_2016_MAG_OTU1]